MGLQIPTYNYGNMILPFTVKVNVKSNSTELDSVFEKFGFKDPALSIDQTFYPLVVPNSCLSVIFTDPEWQKIPRCQSENSGCTSI